MCGNLSKIQKASDFGDELMSDDCLNVAVVGAGKWGRNLVRNFATAGRCRLKYVCDLQQSALEFQKRSFPYVETTADIEEVLANADVDAVVVSTEAVSHFELSRKSLEAGKHTFVEKPITVNSADARTLINVARQNKLKLMVGHLLVYHPAVVHVKEMIDRGQIGQPYYIYTQRVNLGVVRQSENAWWSLAPHDVSLICHLFDSEPVSVAANGKCFLQKDIEDVVFATIQFADGKLAHIHCSWMDPHKIRKMTVVGSERMVTFDDMEATEKVRVYDKAAAIKQDFSTSYSEVISLRFGDIVIPKIPAGEPLALECRHFIDSVLDGTVVRSDGQDGLRVVRILEAGQKSLKSNGEAVTPE
jgi:predicted dehydrogenase